MKRIGDILNRPAKPFNIADFGGLQDDEYLKDEVIYCKKCNENRLFVAEGGKFRARCICKCQKEEQLRQEQEKIERERQKEIEKLQSASLIGERYLNANFDTTETGHNATFDAAFIRCQRYCEAVNTVLAEGLGIYLYGDKGTGKTHLTACMANSLLRKRKQVLFTSFVEISKMIRDTFGSKTESEAAVIHKLATIDFLFIDDMGTERVQTSDGETWLQEKIFDVLNKRYNNKKPTIFTSNYSLPQLVSERGLAGKTVDRIAEMSSAILKVEGESYRMKARAAQKLPF